MSKLIPVSFTAALISLMAIPACAQDGTSSILRTPVDTSRRVSVNWNTAPVKRLFPYKSFILPAALVAYGVVSLHNDGLQDINESIKEELYTERSNQHAIHIDNYLQFGPAIAVYGLNVMGIKGKNNFRDRSMIYGMSELLMTATVFTVKKITGETRPDGSDKYSFPYSQRFCSCRVYAPGV
jgi:hypothetical protein